MHLKYFDVLEYFRESRMPPQVSQTLQEFQNFDITYQEMKTYLIDLKYENIDPEVEKELSEMAINAMKSPDVKGTFDSIRERMSHEKFVAAKNINIEMMKYAM